MLYLLDKFDIDLFEDWESQYLQLEIWKVGEEKIKTWMQYERTRSIFSKQEIINLFKPEGRIQMIQVDKIDLKKYDKIIVFSPKGKFFAMKVTGFL